MCFEFPKTRIKQNECFEMLNDEKGICMLGFQPTNVIMKIQIS